jgi:TatA/E family protein of Tat protein translocase
LFLDIGGGELLVIILAIFLLFGPSKLPEMAKKLGKTIYDLKRASNDITKEITDETRSIKQEFEKAKQGIQDETGNIINTIKNEPGSVHNEVPDDTKIQEKSIK